MEPKKLVIQSTIIASISLVKAQTASSPKATYAPEFYFAIGAGIVLGILVLAFIYFFLKKPKNKWDKEEKKEEPQPQRNPNAQIRPLEQRQAPTRKPMRQIPSRRPRPPLKR